MILFRLPTSADIAHVAEHMRAPDRLECRLLGRHGPREALENGVAISDWSFAAEADGQTQCIFGVGPADGLLGDEGAPWMLGVDGIERHARKILIGTSAYLPRMQAQYETLSNIVHAGNAMAIRYLKWCGFQFSAPFAHEGESFLPFTWTRAGAQRKAA